MRSKYLRIPESKFYEWLEAIRLEAIAIRFEAITTKKLLVAICY